MKEKYYVRRLPTLRTGYAGSSQPADFIVVGDNCNYVELKETAGKRYSLANLQQKSEIEDFIAEVKRLQLTNARYWIVVNFLGQGMVVISGETALEMIENRETLKPENNIVFETFTALKGARIF